MLNVILQIIGWAQAAHDNKAELIAPVPLKQAEEIECMYRKVARQKLGSTSEGIETRLEYCWH